jgi:hypothetical protein
MPNWDRHVVRGCRTIIRAGKLRGFHAMKHVMTAGNAATAGDAARI